MPRYLPRFLVSSRTTYWHRPVLGGQLKTHREPTSHEQLLTHLTSVILRKYISPTFLFTDLKKSQDILTKTAVYETKLRKLNRDFSRKRLVSGAFSKQVFRALQGTATALLLPSQGSNWGQASCSQGNKDNCSDAMASASFFFLFLLHCPLQHDVHWP